MSARIRPDDFDYDVLVVGGGPVGLTAAHALGHFSVRAALVEPRLHPEEGSPRCKQLNPRSMEIFRRLGIADALRDSSKVPAGWSDAATFATSLTGMAIERFDGVFSLRNARTDDLAEPALWCPQNQAEAGLRSALPARTSVDTHLGWRVAWVEQDERAVTGHLVNDSGQTRVIRSKYLIAADGGRSTVRKQLCIPLEGSTDAIQNLQVTFHAPSLAQAHHQGPAVQYWVVNPEVSGLMGQLDLEGNWWAIILNAPDDVPGLWLQNALRTMIGSDVPFTILSEDPWTARMLVAEHYRDRRIFLAGDAAHLNPPWGGFGANTGIGDAMDIAWKLAAVIQGWGGERMLDSYEAERRPMAERTIREASKNMSALGAKLVRPRMMEDGPAGISSRAEVAEIIRRLKTEELYTAGFVLGARYEVSPAICYDTAAAPSSTTSVYRPSGAPGSRLPNQWLTAETALYDLLGDGLSVIDLNTTANPDIWAASAAQASVPLTYIHLNRPDLQLSLDATYLMVRPDGIIAWRSHRIPEDITAVLDQIRGAVSSLERPLTSRIS